MDGWRFSRTFPLFSLGHAELVSASIVPHQPKSAEAKWTLEPQACLHKQVQGDDKEVKPTPQKTPSHTRLRLAPPRPLPPAGGEKWLLPQPRHTFGLILGN